MNGRVANGNDRQRFPDHAAAVGEDPARFLDVDVVERGESHTTKTARDLLVARIRGIDRLGVINAWLQVERSLERGPREPVVELLERRRDWILEHGGRDDRLAEAGDRDQAASKEVVFLDEEGEPYDRSSSASSKLARLGKEQTVATDGGTEADRP